MLHKEFLTLIIINSPLVTRTIVLYRHWSRHLQDLWHHSIPIKSFNLWLLNKIQIHCQSHDCILGEILTFINSGFSEFESCIQFLCSFELTYVLSLTGFWVEFLTQMKHTSGWQRQDHQVEYKVLNFLFFIAIKKICN